MDKFIDKRFERVEKALATLINSIATYNPSHAHANDLVIADAELNQGLDELYTHQSNYSKILSLRQTSQTLDTQIRETLTLLTTTRSELISTPATTFPLSLNPVSYSELLHYARRISKFTLPPSFREVAPQTQESAEAGDSAATPKEPKSETNGTSTPIAVTNGEHKDPGSAMEIDSGTTPGPGTLMQAVGASQNTSNTIIPPLPEDYQRQMNPQDSEIFVPWPHEQIIRRGALASIQLLLDEGIDPWGFDPKQSEALEAARQKKEEEDNAKREEERLEKVRAEEERQRDMQRRMSVSGSLGGERREEVQKPKQFRLDSLDDDDDDD